MTPTPDANVDARLRRLRNLRKGFLGGSVGMAVLAVVSWDHPATWISSAFFALICLAVLVPVSFRIRRLTLQRSEES